jgi:membrane protease YdiL (CAAX protease family)
MNYKQILTFTFLSFLLVSVGFYVVCGGEIPDPTQFNQSWKIPMLMYSPAIAAFLTSKIYKEPWFTFEEVFGNLNRWIVIALFSPIVWTMLTILVSFLLIKNISFNPHLTGAVEINDDISLYYKPGIISHISFDPLGTLIVTLFQGLGQAWAYSMLFALGEELGWRGYLLKKVEYLGFWKSVFIIGPIWGLWHYPLILQGYNYPSNPLLGVPMMMLACTAITPFMIYLRKKSNSIWAPALFHGSFNSLGVIAFMPIHGTTSTFFVGFLGLSGILAAIILFFVFDLKNPIIKA